MEIPLPLANSEARIPSRPQRHLEEKGIISFLHPGYPVPNTLLRLARTDCENSKSVIAFGIHHGTALLACQIIANNTFHSGYFALDSDGHQRVDVPLHGLLTKDRYFFHIDGIDQYPVVPSFRDWRFPHSDIENIWPTRPSDNLRHRALCCLSGSSYAIKNAHIIPREELVWFIRNEMSLDGDINNSGNIIPLRKDLHKCFGDRWFVVIPKPTSSGTRYVTHILLPQATEIWPNHHNIELQCLSQLDGRNFLFARFAWAIIQQVKPFITSDVPRKVIRITVNNSVGSEYVVSDIGGPQLSNLYGGGGSKSATPTKRKFATSANDDCEDSSSSNDTMDSHEHCEDLSSNNTTMDPHEYRDMDFASHPGRRMQFPLPEDVRKKLEAFVASMVASQNLQDVDE